MDLSLHQHSSVHYQSADAFRGSTHPASHRLNDLRDHIHIHGKTRNKSNPKTLNGSNIDPRLLRSNQIHIKSKLHRQIVTRKTNRFALGLNTKGADNWQ